MSRLLFTARAFLDSLSLELVPHGKGHLRDHLVRTAAYLEDWGFDDEVCAAGLFHSILGTSHYSYRALPLHDMPRLVSAIGSHAARLVGLFAVARRPAGLAYALVTGRLGLLHGGEEAVSHREACDLVSIEYANLVDQGGEAVLLKELHHLPLSAMTRANDAVMRSWGSALLAMRA